MKQNKTKKPTQDKRGSRVEASGVGSGEVAQMKITLA
jgi:hypothetical protein